VGLAKGTAHIVLVPVIFSVLLILLGIFLRPGLFSGYYFAILLSLFMAGLLACFFRDPERGLADGIVSPADGYIQRIEEVDEDERKYFKIVTFMNVHNVHVNRAPIDGKVVKLLHFVGSHIPAYKKESERNERVTILLDTSIGKVKIVQIAGIVARRIVPYIREGEEIKKGDRIGIIRLGSRVDLYLPKDKVELTVKEGEKVYAGSSRLAKDLQEVKY